MSEPEESQPPAGDEPIVAEVVSDIPAGQEVGDALRDVPIVLSPACKVPTLRESRRIFLKTLFYGGVAAALGYQQWQIHEQGERLEELDTMEIARRVTPSSVGIIREVMRKGAEGLSESSGFFFRDIGGRVHLLATGHMWAGDNILQGEELQCGVLPYTPADRMGYNFFASSLVQLSEGRFALSPSHAHDLSLLSIPPDFPIPPHVGLQFRDLTEEDISAGERVIVVGHPLHLQGTVTAGIVSCADRDYQPQLGNRVLQIDAPAHTGSSGSMVVDTKGRVIGMVTAVRSLDRTGLHYTENVVFATRADSIAAVLKGWGIQVLPERRRPRRPGFGDWEMGEEF